MTENGAFADAWQRSLPDEPDGALEAISAWPPPEDWSDWLDASELSRKHA